MASGIIVEKEEWEHATEEQRSWMTFKTLTSIDGRLQKLERRVIFDKLLNSGSGVIGGALAYLGLKVGGGS